MAIIKINDFGLARFTKDQFDKLEEMVVIFRDDERMRDEYIHLTRPTRDGYTTSVVITEGMGGGKFKGKRDASMLKRFTNSSKVKHTRTYYADNVTSLNAALKWVSHKYQITLDCDEAFGFVKLRDKKDKKERYIPPARLRDTHYWQTGKTKSYRDDERQAAKEPGWRKSAKGNWYFENRRNRSDTRYELEDKYKKMLKDAEEISVSYPGRWENTHRFKRFHKYKVRRWLDTNTGHLNLPSEILSTMVGAKKAGGNIRILRRRMK